MRIFSCAAKMLGLILAAVAIPPPLTATFAATQKAQTPRPATADEQREMAFAAHDLALRIERSGKLYGIATLDAYLQSVAQKLLAASPAAANGSMRIRALRDADSNAFALPNGEIFVTTGLLLRVENEAQLACILGHELTHVSNYHALQQHRATARKEAWSRALAILFAGAVGAATGDAGLTSTVASASQNAAALWVLTSVNGYSQDLEREADLEGLRRMVTAGYEPKESTRVFEHLMAAAKEENIVAPYFSSHPRLEERLASYQQLLATAFAGSDSSVFIGATEYRSHAQNLAIDQTEILIAGNELDRAAAVLQHDPVVAASARGQYLAGEIHRRQRDDPLSVDLALADYARAVALPNAPADAFRQKALIHRLRGEHAAAIEAFSSYLRLAPSAADAPLIKLYFHEQGVVDSTLQSGGGPVR